MAEWITAERKFDDLIDQVLYNRGVLSGKNEKAKLDFLKPDYKKLNDPFLMKNLKEAVLRIKKAVERGEIVGIFADYDADGIPGAAFLYKALTRLGIKTIPYIPTREEGYGLNKEGVDYLKNKKCSLIITVDLGIRNFNEALYCKEIGIDLIITDHHTPDDQIPEANLVINPKIAGDKYPFKELAGGGVAYKLVQGLSKIYPKKIDESFLKWNLDLIAISTISDVVPLVGENRILANFGLVVLRKSKNLGLTEIYKVSKLDPEKISAYQVGFQIAPRINAPGRMDHATKSFELLVAEDKDEVTKLAHWLEEKNLSRQKAMEKTEKEAFLKAEKESLLKNKILILCGDWIKGVIGPTASRLVEKFNRPVILLSSEGRSFCGSARSVEGVNILDLVSESANYLEKYGGHRGACGLTVLKSKFDVFLNSILGNANKSIKPEDLVRKIKIDAELFPGEISINSAHSLEKLEPFGMGNPRPIFSLSSVSIKNMRFVGAAKNHLSFSLEYGGKTYKAIYFNCDQDKKEMLNNHTLYDVALNLNVDFWNGEKYLKLNIVDIKEHTIV